MHEASFYKYCEKSRTFENLKGIERPSTATTSENEEEVEELSLSHDESGSHLSFRQIAPQLNMNNSSVHTIIKKRKIKAFKKSLDGSDE